MSDPDDGLVSVGEALVGWLERAGVDTVFGIPGVHTIELYRGLATSGIRHVTPRHEQGAVFMADGYTRASGRPGVCLLITGPGLTNALTAMAQARADRIPMLVVSGVNRRETLGKGRGCLHELPDQGALAGAVALSTRTLTEPERLADALEEAFAIMCGPRPGPVHLEIPIDVMSVRIAPFAPRWSPGASPGASLGPSPGASLNRSYGRGGTEGRAADIERAAKACHVARRPLVLAGGGCVRAADELRRLAERLDAPLVTTINARGLLAGHVLEVPASPSLESVRALVAASDLVIAIGTEMGPTDLDMYERGPMTLPEWWIRVDIDPAELAREPLPTQAVPCDAARFAADLTAALGEASSSGSPEDAGSDSSARAPKSPGAERASATRAAALEEIGPDYRALLDVVAGVWRVLPEATLVGDSTQPVYAGNLYVEAPRPRAWFNSAVGYGTLGYAPAAAIGASLGDPRRPVVCLVGDGGLQFSLAELGSARDVDADVAFVVWNNAGYLEIETAMTEAGITPVGVTPSAPDFVAVAEAYGLSACRVRDIPAFERALAGMPRPCLIEFDAVER